MDGDKRHQEKAQACAKTRGRRERPRALGQAPTSAEKSGESEGTEKKG